MEMWRLKELSGMLSSSEERKPEQQTWLLPRTGAVSVGTVKINVMTLCLWSDDDKKTKNFPLKTALLVKLLLSQTYTALQGWYEPAKEWEGDLEPSF